MKSALFTFKNIRNFQDFFFAGICIDSETINAICFYSHRFPIQLHHLKFLKELSNLFILMDSVVKCIYFRRSQLADSLKMTIFVSLSGKHQPFRQKSTKAKLDRFIKYFPIFDVSKAFFILMQISMVTGFVLLF